VTSDTDIAVIGGGPVGAALALALHDAADRELRVSIAKPREEHGGGAPGRGSGHTRRPPQRSGNKRY